MTNNPKLNPRTIRKRFAIKRLSEERKVSIPVAAHIFACMSIKRKKAWQEKVRKENDRKS